MSEYISPDKLWAKASKIMHWSVLISDSWWAEAAFWQGEEETGGGQKKDVIPAASINCNRGNMTFQMREERERGSRDSKSTLSLSSINILFSQMEQRSGMTAIVTYFMQF